jgi:lysophospholipase L1-like esterase
MASSSSRWSAAAAIWFLLVGPGAVLYAGWVLLIDRHYFSRWFVLPFVLGYLAHSFWAYRRGREHLRLPQTARRWIAGILLALVVLGPLLLVYVPALAISVGLCGLADAGWTRLSREASGARRPGLDALCALLSIALLFPAANRLYLIHGVFYTFFRSEPPRMMRNPLFDVNAQGLRGPEAPKTEASDTSRILLLGDSVTWGFPYRWEDTYARHLGDLLTQRGARVRVVNAAIPSQSIVQIRARIPELLAYQPEVAVLMVGYQWTRSVEHAERLADWRPLPFSPAVEWVFLPPFLPELIHLGPRANLRGLTGTTKRWNDEEKNLGSFRAALEDTLRALSDAGVEPLVVGFPALGLDPRVRALVEQEAARSGSRYIDASVLFSSKDEYAFADGIHPDRDGHRQVAELLAGPLIEMLSRSSKREGPY